MNLGRILFGLTVGLWLSTWLAMANPMAPFFLAYPVGFLTL